MWVCAGGVPGRRGDRNRNRDAAVAVTATAPRSLISSIYCLLFLKNFHEQFQKIQIIICLLKMFSPRKAISNSTLLTWSTLVDQIMQTYK